MSTDNALRLDVPSPGTLAELATADLPLGLRGGKPTRSFHRDIYLDTPDGELERRGVICRFRIGSDDRRTLTVDIRESQFDTLVDWERFESNVSDTDALAALQGSSEPARRLQAVIDSRRLGTRIELEVERKTRVVRSAGIPLRTFEIGYDQVAVHSGSLTRQFCEMEIRRLRRGGPSLEELADALQHAYGLRPNLASQLERAEDLLSAMEGDVPAEGVATIPEVTLVAVKNGHIAMRADADTLRLPLQEGRGEETSRSLGEGVICDATTELQLLDTLAATPGSPALEVWLAGDALENAEAMEQQGMVWVPYEDLFALAGAPALRDPKTLAALAFVARSEAFANVSSGPSGEAPSPLYSREALCHPTLSPEQLDPESKDPNQFLNRETSELEFNQRLIEMAEDPSVPLLARMRFLSIFSSNLDEFFMVRVGGLRRAVAEGKSDRGLDKMAAHERLDAIAVRLRYLLSRQKRCLEESCLPALAEQGIRIRPWADLDDEERASLKQYFTEQVFPLLTPHAITRAPGHPFPHITNLSLSLAVMVRDNETGRLRFGTITLPTHGRRFIPLEGDRDFVPLEEVVKENLGMLYPGRRVEAVHCFRVTRSGDIHLDESAAEDLLEAVEEEVKQRPFAGVVRLAVERTMPRDLRDLLQREMRMVGGGRGSMPGAAGIYEVDGLLDLTALSEIADIDRPDLQYPRFEGVNLLGDGESIFDRITQGDVLVHHPYDAFGASTEQFFVQAAADPDVQAIKLTLYRAGSRSPVVNALIEAARAGKKVDVFVELKARFDEERNIDWVRKLEAAGVHVVYGLVNYKTHAKTTLVIRREGNAVRRYVHIGTGNYNASTAKLYTDLGILSADPDLCSDLSDLFNELTGSSQAPQTPFRQLLVAPTNMLSRFLEMIDREIEHATAGRGGRIRVKVNGLADAAIIRSLYRASQAGVEIDLLVRSICNLRPGVPGLSERIRVICQLGSFLEHARIYHFGNAGNDEYYIGSADWRPRNLRRRVEVVTPVLASDSRVQLNEILETELADPLAWELRADGSYQRRRPADGSDRRTAQEQFMDARRSSVPD